MITVRMIQYWNDYHKKELQERFRDLEELADWIFKQMKADYSSEHGRNLLSFPKCDTKDGIYEISVRPECGGHVFWIKQIEDECSGIIFSDGTFTAGQKHCTRAVREWLTRCENRKEKPTFNFAPDETETDADFKEDFMSGRVVKYHMGKDNKNFNEDYVSGRLVKKAAKKINNAGGCDAEDEYSRGYDDAIAAALNILLEETGYSLEEILDYEEDKEAENDD
ncbi:MAG: hypothetical protein NC124_17485 [Clostridium sp.]|nr:hypothetical protein [Clostridium sp.]